MRVTRSPRRRTRAPDLVRRRYDQVELLHRVRADLIRGYTRTASFSRKSTDEHLRRTPTARLGLSGSANWGALHSGGAVARRGPGAKPSTDVADASRSPAPRAAPSIGRHPPGGWDASKMA